jgi:hypothetical protein
MDRLYLILLFIIIIISCKAKYVNPVSAETKSGNTSVLEDVETVMLPDKETTESSGELMYVN